MSETNGEADGNVAVARPALKRNLGMTMATALVIGNMIGSGIFLLPSALAAEAGPVSILAWVFTGVGAMLLALVFANLGRAYPQTGGPYVYARRAFGDFIGFQTAWSYWINAWVGNAAIAIAFAGYLAVFWGDATRNWIAALIAIGLIWLFTAANILGVREAGWIQVVTTVLKFVPLLLIGVVGLFFMDTDNFSPFTLDSGFDWGIGAAALLTLWAFIGLESATVPAEEVKNPEKTIPRATIFGTAATSIVYLIATLSLFGMIASATLAGSSSPFADGANVIFGGTWGGKAIAIVAMISIAGVLNGWILLQGRAGLGAAQDGLFPRRFARVDEKRGTPIFGLVASSVLITGLLLTNLQTSGTIVDTFTDIIILATLSALIPYAFAAAAQVHLFFTDRKAFSTVHLLRYSIIAALAFSYSLWAIWGAGTESIAKGFMLFLLGIPIYIWVKWERRGTPSVPETVPAAAEEPARTPAEVA